MQTVRRIGQALAVVLLLSAAAAAAPPQARQQWTPEQAQQWYKAQPWLVGANYNPASAINQLEMWQADTFDPKRIDLELGWAAGIGMNMWSVTPTRSPHWSLSTRSSASAAAAVTWSFSRPIRYRRWLRRSPGLPGINPSGSQISGRISMTSPPRGMMQ